MSKAILYPQDLEATDLFHIEAARKTERYIGMDGTVQPANPPYDISIEIRADTTTVANAEPLSADCLQIIVTTPEGMFNLDYSGNWPAWKTYVPEE